MNDRPYTLVVGAAPVPGHAAFYRSLLEDAAHVVAADGAAEWCLAHGRTPDLAVGDFDSARPGAPERLAERGIETRVVPVEKDETDLELAASLARERYRERVVLTAAFTERVDHTLAALGVLVRSGTDAEIAEPGFIGRAVTSDDPLEMQIDPDVEFSVIATGPAEGVRVAGAKWPLEDAALDPLSGRGVSNATDGNLLRVSVKAGTLIVLIRTANGRRYTQ